MSFFQDNTSNDEAETPSFNIKDLFETDMSDDIGSEEFDKTPLGIAREALQRQRSHERLCALRWKHLGVQLEQMNNNIKQINDKIWALACATIILLLAAVGTLVVEFMIRGS